MTKTILIENLKNVNELLFKMPGPGVWLLTGENGGGKTTLLACLYRLGDRNSFPRYFQTSNKSDRLDTYNDSKVTFSINEESVSYTYAGTRWSPKPKKNSGIVSGFGYASVIFVGANAERITPKPEDFDVNRVHAVPNQIKIAANKIFTTNKFDNLRKVNVTRGQNEAFVFKHGDKYYSEKNFSLGELCVLKLLKKLRDAPANSLIIIDELEMAIHPTAQVKLYHYLKEISEQRGHTIIFSTHSVSLIKTADRSRIIFLSRNQTKIDVEIRPYVSRVLGGLAHIEEKSTDIVFYVEDVMAEFCARSLITLVAAEKISAESKYLPKFEVVPIGGFSHVISFLKRHDTLHRSGIQSYALLDRDVKDESVSKWEDNNQHDKLAWLDDHANRIKYLPWTPEVGIVNLFRSDEGQALERLRTELGDPQIYLRPDLDLPPEQATRANCKAWVSSTVKYWKDENGIEEEKSQNALCTSIASQYFDENRPDAMALIGPMLS